jgi:2-amino-4-hydroxy-6-hydroxymethyldihydropteridine diphosphokinase
MRGMAHVFVGLGTNLGDREAQLRAAEAQLRGILTSLRGSRVYETEPWGVTEQPRFLNRVVEGETDLSPLALLEALQGIEREMGRVRDVRYGPRTIDLDLLLYGDMTLETPGLEIPHPRLHERRFVLVPLAELAPDVIHPRLNRSIRELLESIPDDGGVRLYVSQNRGDSATGGRSNS